MSIEKIINSITPKHFFLIDALGALLSAFSLGVVLVKFESAIGIPKKILFSLSFLAILFAANSFYCFLRINKDWKKYLKFIGIINLSYCCLTIGLLFFLHDKITFLGKIYFVLEIVIISFLAFLEIKKTKEL